jgi:lipid-binding SYLF domain-containing protein
MKRALSILACAALSLAAASARADEFEATADKFRKAGQSAEFFNKSYGYAVFPTVGKGGLGIGGAYGKGRVYAGGRYVGDVSLAQLSVGFQAGGQAYSEIVFFEHENAFKEFTNGTFEFDARASAVAITAGASASAGTSGARAGASATEDHAKTGAPGFYRGFAVFTIARGGLMYEASIAGQKFNFKPPGK